MMVQQSTATDLPGSDLDVSKMPGHWLLARLGKWVLRPGGLGLTENLLKSLAIDTSDDVVEFAPGLGATARLILERQPHRYVGVERDLKATRWTTRHLPQQPNVSLVVGAADKTNLPANSASVVLGEAMLSMNTQEHKQRIVAFIHVGARPRSKRASRRSRLPHRRDRLRADAPTSPAPADPG
jgi:hypothetical protein